MREQSVAERHEPSAPVNRVPGHVVETAPLGRPAPKPDVQRKIKPAFEFSKAILLEENHMKTGSRTLSGAIAVLLHVGVIAGVILAGLYFADPLTSNNLRRQCWLHHHHHLPLPRLRPAQ